MAIGLIDIDSTLPNLALMKLSAYYKSLGEKVEFVQEDGKYEKIHASAILTKSQEQCEKLKKYYGSIIEIGGSGWEFDVINGELVQIRNTVLPDAIEYIKPDYSLYTAEMIYKRIRGIMTKESRMKKAKTIVNAGMGFTSRGCIRNCGFCLVPKKEGCFHHVADISKLLNEKSNVLILDDNNFTADPDRIDKMHEIRDRGLIVDINQGCDIRLMDDATAKALSEIKHLRSVHYAWDLMNYEKQIMQGIKILLKYVKAWRHMCFMLVGYNTTFEEDMYRFRKLMELGVTPHVMIYNDKKDLRLKHFERWVNSKICKACSWEEYEPWVKDQIIYSQVCMF